MEGPSSSSNNDDEEPQICTVFSSNSSTQSKTIFDTISFSMPKKENSVMSPTSPFSEYEGTSSAKAISEKAFQQISSHPNIQNESDIVIKTHPVDPVNPVSSSSMEIQVDGSVPSAMFESLSMSYIGNDQLTPSFSEGLSVVPESEQSLLQETLIKKSDGTIEPNEQDSPIPTANTLFADAPDVPFPVGVGSVSSSLVSTVTHTATAVPATLTQENLFVLQNDNVASPIDTFSSITYSTVDTAYDAWIPLESTRQVLMGIATAVHAGNFFPDKSHMTTPGIIYKEDLVDKVAVNMSRIFGEADASKRQILTADSVTQDDNGIRELIKLGCYRSAINLTKRLLTLYGQGPGKIDQFSKHTPHSLQLWMTRIALMIRIREFKIAESELDAFKDFQNPDMFYEYYQDSYGLGRKGSMVPFYFRLLAAEIPQYASKDHNESVNKLSKLLQIIQQILKNINDGISEDGSSVTLDKERREASLNIWSKREARVLYSLTNAFLLAKDCSNAVKHLNILKEKETDKKPQLTSAIGRVYLQYGDLTISQKYFKEAASMRTGNTESERVENLVDASMYSIAQGVYADAFGLLKEALAIQPDNFMITNNLAVCLLYMGKVKESLALMETTVRNNTPQLIQENVILNLSTIYELENSDGQKKNSLLKLISEYKGDGINLASLKMPNLI